MIRAAAAMLWLMAPAGAQQPAEPSRPEFLLLLPEPRELRTPLSVIPEGAQRTVLSPAQEIAGRPGIVTYDRQDFQKLGLSVETFAARARKTADRLLATLEPDLIRDAAGKIQYAVFRGPRPIMACLLIAPSLAKRFESVFGPEVWVAVPDRHALYVFPAKAEAIGEFAADLAARYRSDAYAASPEIFSLRAGREPQVIGSLEP